MRIAYILFPGITWLDFIGLYDPISRLRSLHYMPDLDWDTCAFTETVSDSFGLALQPTLRQNDLSVYDAIVVPGDLGTRSLQTDEDFLAWLRTATPCRYKISICTGSLLLGAAGFLRDKQATTHYREYDTLEPYCRQVVKERIVEDGDTLTAGAVSSSLDLGLYLCRKWAGEEAERTIRTGMDYHG